MEATLTLMLKQLLAATVAMAMIMTRNNASCSTLQLVQLVAMMEADVQNLHD